MTAVAHAERAKFYVPCLHESLPCFRIVPCPFAGRGAEVLCGLWFFRVFRRGWCSLTQAKRGNKSGKYGQRL
ncbi:hypothetical protein Defa_21480 [Desulfovibrio sp. TH_2024_36128]|uniref:Uncharacterized protein n=1 Tax=Desulfovibrio falkowii TaxID=3136602 RepID=A0ABQ0EAQ5_9BACT